MTSNQASCALCGSDSVSTERVTVPAESFGFPSGTLHGVRLNVCAECGERSHEIPAHGAVVKEYRRQLAQVNRDLTSEEFAYLRRALALSGRAYADALGVSNVTISRLENGSDIPALQQAAIRAVTLIDLQALEGISAFIKRDKQEVEFDVRSVEIAAPKEVSGGWRELEEVPCLPRNNVIPFPVLGTRPRQLQVVEFEETWECAVG